MMYHSYISYIHIYSLFITADVSAADSLALRSVIGSWALLGTFPTAACSSLCSLPPRSAHEGISMNAAVSAALASLDPSDTRRSPTMRGPQTEAIRRSLHLSIDPTPYREATSSTSDSSPSPILSTRASVATTNTTYSVVPADDECRICSVFCLFDYWSDDADHLSFRKGDFLDIVKQEETGWWAAMRPGGNRVGWIPCGYVQTLADDTAKTIARVDSAILMWSPEEKQSRPGTIRRNSELPAADVSGRNEWDSGDADEEHVRGLSFNVHNHRSFR
jgi:hypothetical protein